MHGVIRAAARRSVEKCERLFARTARRRGRKRFDSRRDTRVAGRTYLGAAGGDRVPVMRLGLHISNFTWPDGAPRLGAVLGDVARAADDAGFDRISVMDHLWQIGVIGPPEHEMLEAYTALGLPGRAHLARQAADPGHRRRLPRPRPARQDRHHARRALRRPGDARHRRRVERGGVARPRPALPADRRALRAAGGGAADLPADVDGDETAVRGQALPARPYAQLAGAAQPAAPADPDRWRRREEDAAAGRPVRRRLQPVPRPGVAAQAGRAARSTARTVGRDYDDIEKTVLFNFNLGEHGERVDETIEGLRRLAGLGFTVAHGSLRNAYDTDQFEIFGRRSSRRRRPCDASGRSSSTWTASSSTPRRSGRTSAGRTSPSTAASSCRTARTG